MKPKLSLTKEERIRLRKSKIKMGELHTLSVDNLKSLLEVTPDRASYIYAQIEFQSIPSIGPKMADALIYLGFYDLNSLREEDGADLLNRYESKLGYWVDPCVEDSFRCATDHGKNRESIQSWWNFSEERKKYRASNGYPSSRPKKAWHENEKSLEDSRE